VVGVFYNAGSPVPHSFITGANGVGITDLNALVTLPGGVSLQWVAAINDMGQIVADASNGHSYLLSPVPEPETYALMLAGLGLMRLVARRKLRPIA
jgi:hypothetical protein